ncbi:MAG: hypothetical protein A2Y10_00350 [Planctomycetes bacterium GWF2_41_51]|nr:MAG: hypothetical protein A2Y10_00350 [Planctomycetes bacterium GWF2_41_51]HBG26076.1 hypothetical protein [Phycisphaerales bacterium]
MKNVKSKFLLVVFCTIIYSVIANASQTIVIYITEGTSGSDGYSIVNDTTINTNGTDLRTGWNAGGWQGVAQSYFKIPDLLKAPGVNIISAKLRMKTHYTGVGNSGYIGAYFQLMHYNSDTGTVSLANGNATDNPANYTRIGDVRFQIATDNSDHYWDVKAQVESDIASGWTYFPFLTRLTDIDGDFIASPTSSFGGYECQFWSSEAVADDRSYIVVEYDYNVKPAPLAKKISIDITEGLNGSDGYSIVNDTTINNTGSALRVGWNADGWQGVAQTYFKIPDALKVPGVNIISATLKMETMYNNPGSSGYNGVYFQLMHYNYDTGTVSLANGNATNDPNSYTKVDFVHYQASATNSVHTWDVKSRLQADISAGWTYLPLVTRLTNSSGVFIASPTPSFGAYECYFWASESGNRPYVEVVYEIKCGISEGVNGSDGYSIVNDATMNDNSNALRMGWNADGWQSVAQTYFKIPNALKVPGVTLINATLRMKTWWTGTGNSGYNGAYFQLMHYNYDTGTVSLANGNATSNPANYSKVGGIHFQIATDNSYHYWDITSKLQADIAAGWTYSPFAARLTDINGAFISSPTPSLGGYECVFFSSEAGDQNAPEIIYTYITEAAQPLSIIQSGVAETAIVIPTRANMVEEHAADELQYHIMKATGVTLEIYKEANEPDNFYGLIYVGACNAAAEVGIDGNSLEDNGYLVRNVGPNLFFAGHDSSGNPLGCLQANYTRIGTMLAVYRFLEQEMNVKWLWPGPLGEIIPTVAAIEVNSINITGKPVLKHTRLHDYNIWNWNAIGQPLVGWATEDALEDFLNEQSLWMRRQGFCRSINLEYSHAFSDWWDTYNSTHPEYFNLLPYTPSGQRVSDPYYVGGRDDLVSMCLSNTNLHQQIVDNWIDAGASGYINCAENDTATKCTCSNCMAMDVQDPDLTIPWAQRLTYAATAFNNASGGNEYWYNNLGSMGTRLAKYILAVQQKAADNGYPDANLFAFAYMNYSNGPLCGANLNDRVTIGCVPNFCFPWTDAKSELFRNSWSKWANSGAVVFLRPNYFLDGHNFPIYFADRFGNDFIYALKRNMLAATFDSLTGQWSTQSPNLYMLARVQTHVGADIADPDSEVDSILDEFYEAFGPAESAVRAYFDHWKTVSESTTIEPAYGTWFVKAPDIFSPSVMKTGRTLMMNAQTAAQGNSTAVRLVSFLEKGLTNAEKTLAAQAAWSNYDGNGRTWTYWPAWQSAFQDLNNYRASVEANSICNMGWLRVCENDIWNFNPPTSGLPGPATNPNPAIGDDGFTIVNDYTLNTVSSSLRMGWNALGWQSVAQTYFRIPDALKTPGVTITSATLGMTTEYTQAGNTGYNGAYFQLMHHNYDTGTVSLTNGNATDDPNLYTKIGNVHYQSAASNSTHTWDVKSMLIEDINSGNTYLPMVTRLTDSNGDLIFSPTPSFGAYQCQFFSSDLSSNQFDPRITVVTNIGSFSFGITDSATGISTTPTLSWTACGGAASHDVYFGTNQANVANATRVSVEFKVNQTSTTYAPGTLNGKTTYYWRIDEVGTSGTTKGTVWGFTTRPNPPTFVASGTITSNTTAITPALPAGIAANDILLLFIETNNQAISIANQNGGTWTQVANSPQGTTGTMLTVFWSRYNGTQGAPTTSDSGDHQIGRMIAIRGAATSGNPWDVTAGNVESTSDTTGSIPGATTTVPNTLVIAAVTGSLPDAIGTANFTSWTNANLTSLTERIDNTRDSGNGGAIGVVTGVKGSAGGYGNTAVTHASSATKGMISIAIKP